MVFRLRDTMIMAMERRHSGQELSECLFTGDLQVKGSGKQPAGFSPKVGETSGVYAALSTDDVRAAGPVARHGWLPYSSAVLCVCAALFWLRAANPRIVAGAGA